MKNKKYLILFTMTAMLCVMWVSVLGGGKSKNHKYQEYIKKAEQHEQKEAYITAADNYLKALKIYPDDYGLMIKIAENYMKCDDRNGFLQYCDMAADKNASADEPYLLKAEYYSKAEEYEDAINILNCAPKKDMGDKVERMLSTLQYKFSDSYHSYSDMKYFYDGYASVQNEKGHWGIADSEGNIRLTARYDEIGGAYNKDKDIVSVCEGGEWYFSDLKGRKKYVPDNYYSFLGTYSEGFAPFEYKGKYGYMDLEYNEYSCEFDYAGAFLNGVAAVKKNGKWALIDTRFKNVTEFIYDDIKTDCYGFCINDPVITVSRNGEEYNINKNGKKTDNDMKYSCGLTPVCDDNMWGYADMSGKMVIEPQYQDVNPFTETGTASVKENGSWHVIKLYSYK